MDKLADITKLIQERLTQDKPVFTLPNAEKTTDPIAKQLKEKMANFHNENITKKFNLNDLLR